MESGKGSGAGAEDADLSCLIFNLCVFVVGGGDALLMCSISFSLVLVRKLI